MAQWKFNVKPDGSIDVIVRAPGGEFKGQLQTDTYVDFDAFVAGYPAFVDENETKAPLPGPP